MPVYSSISSQPSGESYTVFARGYGKHSSPESLAKLDRQMPQPAARTKDHQLFVLLQGQIVIKPSQRGSSIDKQSPCLFDWHRGGDGRSPRRIQRRVFSEESSFWVRRPGVSVDQVAILEAADTFPDRRDPACAFRTEYPGEVGLDSRHLSNPSS